MSRDHRMAAISCVVECEVPYPVPGRPEEYDILFLQGHSYAVQMMHTTL